MRSWLGAMLLWLPLAAGGAPADPAPAPGPTETAPQELIPPETPKGRESPPAEPDPKAAPEESPRGRTGEPRDPADPRRDRTGQQGDGTPFVATVEIRVPEGEDPAPLDGLVTVSPGDPLSRKAIRRSVQRLYETGRFANVIASAVEGEDGIQVIFELEPHRSILSLRVVGALQLGEAAVRKATDLKEGEAFSEDRIDRAVAGLSAAYGRLGYEQAKIRIDSREAGKGVILEIVVDEGPPTRLGHLKLEGDPGDPKLVRDAISLKTGDVLDLARLESELERLRATYRAAGHYRARVGAPKVTSLLPGLAEVEVEVRAGPRIEFAFAGNRTFASSRLLAVLDYRGEDILDGPTLGDLAGRIERAYRRAGWFDARVFTSEAGTADGTVVKVTFHVVEGRSLFVKAPTFHGNRGIASQELQLLVQQALLAGRQPEPLLAGLLQGELDGALGHRAPPLARPVDPLHVWDHESAIRIVEALLARYRDEGWLDVAIDPPRLEIDEVSRVAEVHIRIREGDRVRISRVDIEGMVAKDPVAFRSQARALVRGRPVSEPRIREERLRLQAAYAREGHLYAQVETAIERQPDDPSSAVVRLVVREGPQVRAGRILIRGHRRTNDSVVEDALLFREGEVLGSESLTSSQQRLMRLGIFRTAAIRPLDPDVAEPVKDIVVDLRERPGRSLEIGGGVSIADGPRAFGEFTERNIFGRNLELGIRGRVNYQAFREEVRNLGSEGLERYVDVGLRYPRIYGLPIELGWRVDLIHERDIRPAYQLHKYGALTGFDLPISRRLQASLLYEVEWNTTERSARYEELYGDLSLRDLERLRSEGNTLLGSLRPTLTLDLRNDPVAPTAGVFAKFETDFARSIGGETWVNFLKLGGTVTGYIPVGGRSTLALSVSGGRVIPLDDRSTTIAPKRFFLGGASTIRGFSEDGLVPEDRREALRREISDCLSLVYPAGCSSAARFLQAGRSIPSDGGDVYALARAELRFPIRGDLMGGIFLEGGNLWVDPSAFDPLALRPTSGFGLRYATPVGPVALDLGFNLNPDKELNESPMALHFSIGLF